MIEPCGVPPRCFRYCVLIQSSDCSPGTPRDKGISTDSFHPRQVTAEARRIILQVATRDLRSAAIERKLEVVNSKFVKQQHIVGDTIKVDPEEWSNWWWQNNVQKRKEWTTICELLKQNGRKVAKRRSKRKRRHWFTGTPSTVSDHWQRWKRIRTTPVSEPPLKRLRGDACPSGSPLTAFFSRRKLKPGEVFYKKILLFFATKGGTSPDAKGDIKPKPGATKGSTSPDAKGDTEPKPGATKGGTSPDAKGDTNPKPAATKGGTSPDTKGDPQRSKRKRRSRRSRPKSENEN